MSACVALIADTEIASCTETLSSHDRTVTDAKMVTPQYNLDCFLKANPVFSEQLKFHYEAVQDDPVRISPARYSG